MRFGVGSCLVPQQMLHPLRYFPVILVVCIHCVYVEDSIPQLVYRIYGAEMDHLVLVDSSTDTERIFHLIGSSNGSSTLSAIVMRGSLHSSLEVNATSFFRFHNEGSIVANGITESHGFLIVNVSFMN